MRAIAICALALACAAPVLGQGVSKADTERALIANEKKMLEAVAKHDIATVKSLFTADAVGIDNTGMIKMPEWLPQIEKMKVDTWEITQPQVLWVDDKTAVVLYTWTGKATFEGQPLPEKFYASTVWTERNGKWVSVFHQESLPMPAHAEKK